ncbi:MAG: rhodanese-like domain-containing protein [Sulfurovum sp.]|nr:rhodanese-like domain-containing protein [Sulfurovum sp.]
MQELLTKDNINSSELEQLLEARQKGEADFLLVDVREQMEYDMGHIKGVDMLKPTSVFQDWAEAFLNENKDKAVIFTCRTGSRSGQVQHVFKSNGMERAVNHYGGIVTYSGDIER